MMGEEKKKREDIDNQDTHELAARVIPSPLRKKPPKHQQATETQSKREEKKKYRKS